MLRDNLSEFEIYSNKVFIILLGFFGEMTCSDIVYINQNYTTPKVTLIRRLRGQGVPDRK